jgi:hypothetical protein
VGDFELERVDEAGMKVKVSVNSSRSGETVSLSERRPGEVAIVAVEAREGDVEKGERG